MADVQDKGQDTASDFGAQLRGLLIREGDDAYDDARMVYNAMIDKNRPLSPCAQTSPT